MLDYEGVACNFYDAIADADSLRAGATCLRYENTSIGTSDVYSFYVALMNQLNLITPITVMTLLTLITLINLITIIISTAVISNYGNLACCSS